MYYNLNNSLLRRYMSIRIHKSGYGKNVYYEKYKNENYNKKKEDIYKWEH